MLGSRAVLPGSAPAVYPGWVFSPRAPRLFGWAGDGWWRVLCLETRSPALRKLRGPLPALPSCIQGEDRMGKTLAVSHPEKRFPLPAGLQ